MADTEEPKHEEEPREVKEDEADDEVRDGPSTGVEDFNFAAASWPARVKTRG